MQLPNPVLRKLVTFLFAVSAGCGGKLVSLAPEITVSPTTLAFGAGAVGVPQEIRVSVTDTGSALLHIGAIKVASDPNGELAVSDLLTTDCEEVGRAGGLTLVQAECARFTVIWTPKAAHAAAGSIEVDSDDPTNSVVTLPVNGSATAPALQICVLKSDGTVDPAKCSDFSTNPPQIPTVDFGAGAANVLVNRTVRLTNQGQAPLTFTRGPLLTAASAPVFDLTNAVPGSQIAAGATVDLVLTAKPAGNGTLMGELDLTSNDTRSPQVALPLQVFVAGWKLCIDPAAGLDFGGITVGQSQKLTVTMTNCGSVDFQISKFSFGPFAPTTTQFTLPTAELPAVPSAFAAGAQLKLDVTYAPTAVQTDTASIDYQLTLADNSIIQDSVPITGKGLQGACGTSGAANPVSRIISSFSASQNGNYTVFNPSQNPSPVVPLDWVKLNGGTSTVASGTPSYTWQIVSQPAGSTTVLVGSGVQVTMQTLVSGTYVVSLTVKDGAGCVDTSQVTIQVVPAGAVHVELTWAESCGDVDLHYSAPNTSFCANSDVSWDNENPDWGCTTNRCGGQQNPGGGYADGSTADDASLDHDDTWGNGPENITQRAPFDSPAGAPYQVYVYYYSAKPDSGTGSGTCGNAHPTVNVYINGTLTNTYRLSGGMSHGQVWKAATISVANQGSLITVAAGDTSAQSTGACHGGG